MKSLSLTWKAFIQGLKKFTPVKKVIGVFLAIALLVSLRSAPYPTKLPEIPFKVVAITLPCQEKITLINLPGRTHAWQSSTLKARISGKVSTLHFKRGNHVNLGDLLITLDPEEREAVHEKARLVYDSALKRYERNARLKASKFVSQESLEILFMAKAEAAANLASIKTQLDHTKISAPFSGIIEVLKVSTGDTVTPGSSLLKLVSLDPLCLITSVSARQRPHLQLNQQATVRIQGYPPQEATLEFISSVADKDTGGFELRFTLPNLHHTIPAGLAAIIELKSKKTSQVHRLPWSALTLDNEGHKGIKVLDQESCVHFYPVEILSSSPTHIVVSGLPPESVICLVQGQEYVTPGQLLSAQDVIHDASNPDS